MERLTEITHRGTVHLKGTVANYSSISYECQLEEGSRLLNEALKKLAEYENAEDNGLLLRLPCRIGSTVFFILEDSVDKDNVNGYVVSSPHKIIEVCKSGFFTGQTKDFLYDSDFTEWEEIGKTVFLTKAEAESKLAEMEGE